MKEKKIIIITSIIIGVLTLTLGVTFAIFNFSKVSVNSKLVLGDIYMHYNEPNQGINLEGMMPIDEYSLNASTEAISTCVEYLYNTYGSNWNNLTYSSVQEKSNKNNEAIVKPIVSARTNTYDNYCKGEKITISTQPSVSSSQGYSDVKVLPIADLPKPAITVYILDDLKNGTLTNADKTYLETNSVLVNNIKSLANFEFTITGKNTHTKNGILYNIQLVKGDIPADKTEVNRIQDKFLKFKLVEVVDGVETVLQNNLTIEDINGNSIYSDTIPKNTTSEITKTYRLYMWVDSSVVICGGDATDCDYTVDTWNNLFASIKVNVNGAYTEGENFVEKVKSRYNVDTKQDGLVAVNTAGDLAANGDTIREYRYSGIGNYCTYTDGTNDYNLSVSGTTCPTSACFGNGAVINGDSDGFVLYGSCADSGGTTLSLKNGQTTPTDSGLRNYVTFNNEMWRIVGIFNEENASGRVEERIKLVKDEPISLETEVESTITKNGVTYNTFKSSTGSKYKYFYWNNPDANYTGNGNDWTKAGSQYYLNETYYNNLSNNNLIEEMKYYLGNVTTDSSGFLSGTNAEVYTQERGSEICDSSVTSWSQNSSCNIWYGNQATWNGKIALLYPSDFGYASDVANWSNDYQTAYSNGLSLTNWMFNNEMSGTWFLSPSSSGPIDVSDVGCDGFLIGNIDADSNAGIRPVLSLGSQTKIITGTGSYEDPYQLMG